MIFFGTRKDSIGEREELQKGKRTETFICTLKWVWILVGELQWNIEMKGQSLTHQRVRLGGGGKKIVWEWKGENRVKSKE